MSGGRLFYEASWSPPAGVHALFTVKRAGSFGADARAQRAALAPIVGLPAAPRWLKQVHGIAVADLDSLPDTGAVPEADAAVTSQIGVVCAIQTADCLPLLFAAADGSAVAAAHAGWRGLAAGVIEATVARLREKLAPGAGISAWLGPAISAAHFEVGSEVREAFCAQDAQAAAAFLPNDRGRWQCDLYALARLRLASLGIADVGGGEHCTFAEVPRFFSHRRDTGPGRATGTGRMVTLIWRS